LRYGPELIDLRKQLSNGYDRERGLILRNSLALEPPENGASPPMGPPLEFDLKMRWRVPLEARTNSPSLSRAMNMETVWLAVDDCCCLVDLSKRFPSTYIYVCVCERERERERESIRLLLGGCKKVPQHLYT